MFYTYTIVGKEKKGGKEKTGENVNLLPPPRHISIEQSLMPKKYIFSIYKFFCRFSYSQVACPCHFFQIDDQDSFAGPKL
jgi:hypothetical protein